MQSVYREAMSQSYKITKAALNMLTVLYAQELEQEGFAVFCVSPGVRSSLPSILPSFCSSFLQPLGSGRNGQNGHQGQRRES